MCMPSATKARQERTVTLTDCAKMSDLDMPELVSSDEEQEYYEVGNDEYVRKWIKLGPEKLKAEEEKMMLQALGPFLFGFDVVAPAKLTTSMGDSQLEMMEFMREVIKRNRKIVGDAGALRDVLDMIAQIEKNSVSTEVIEPIRAIDTAMKWPLCFDAWKELSSANKKGRPFCLVFFYKIVQHHVIAYGTTGQIKSELILKLKMSDPEKAKTAKEQGNNFFRLGHHAEAVDMYSEAIKQDCLSATLYGNRAQAYLNCKFYREAYCDTRRAIVLNCKSPKFYYRCAEACIHLERLEEAEQRNTQGLELCKRNHGDFEKFEPQLQRQKEKIVQAMAEKQALNKKKPDRKPTAEYLALQAAQPEPPAPKPKVLSSDIDNAKKDKEESAAKAPVKPPEPVDHEKLEQEDLAKYSTLNQEALAALQQENNPIRAFSKFQSAHELWSHSCYVKSKLTETDELILRYACGITAVLQDGSKAIQEGLEIFQGMQREPVAQTFPLLYYGMGRAFTALYSLGWYDFRFFDGIEPIQTGLRLTKMKKKAWKEVCWPSSEQVIEESRLKVYKRVMEELLTLCRYPPVPDAVCSMHVDHDDEHVHIYFQSPTFMGYTQVTCHMKCRITFHPHCWKHFKTTVAEKARDKDLLNLPCPTPDCGSAIYRIFLCRTGSKMDNKELISSVKPVKEAAGDHKAKRMRMSNPDRIAKKLERKELRHQKRREALEARLLAAQKEKEKEALVENIHLTPDQEEHYQDALAIPSDALTKLDREKDDEGVKYHVNFSDNREATLLGEEDADVDEKDKNNKTLSARVAGPNSFEVPHHLKPQMQSLASIVAQSSRQSDSTITENLFEFFSGILSEHGPLSLKGLVMLRELSELPDEAKQTITRAGGPEKFFRQSLKFVVIGDIVANIKDTKMAHALSRQGDAPNGHSVEGSDRQGSVARPVLGATADRTQPNGAFTAPSSSPSPLSMMSYSRVVTPSLVSLSENNHDGRLSWTSGGAESMTMAQESLSFENFGVEDIDTGVPSKRSWSDVDVTGEQKTLAGRLNPAAPEFQPGNDRRSPASIANSTDRLQAGPTLDNDRLFLGSKRVTLANNSATYDDGDQGMYSSSGARPKDKRPQSYDALDTFVQTFIDGDYAQQTAIDSLDDIDDLNLPVQTSADDPLSVHDMDALDDANVLPPSNPSEAGLAESVLTGLNSAQVAQAGEQDVTLSRRSSKSDLSQTSEISMGGLFRTSSPSSSVSSVKIGSSRDMSSPHLSRDGSSPLVARDVASPLISHSNSIPHAGHRSSSSSSAYDIPTPHMPLDSVAGDTNFSHSAVVGAETSELGFGENFAANFDKTASHTLPESPVPPSLSDSPTPQSPTYNIGAEVSNFNPFSGFRYLIGHNTDQHVSVSAGSVRSTVRTKDVFRSEPEPDSSMADMHSAPNAPKPLKPLAPISAVKNLQSSSSNSSLPLAQPSLSMSFPLTSSSDTWALAPSSSSPFAPSVPLASEVWSDDSFPSSVRPDEDLSDCVNPVSFPVSSQATTSRLFPTPAAESALPPPIPLPSFSSYGRWSDAANNGWNTAAATGAGVVDCGKQFAEAATQAEVEARSVAVNTDLDVEALLRGKRQADEENVHLVQQLQLIAEEQRRLQHIQTEKTSLDRQVEEVRQERNKAVQQMNNLEISLQQEKRNFLEREARLEEDMKSLKEQNALSAMETGNLLSRVSETERKVQAEEHRAKSAEMEVVRLRMQLNLQQLERRKNEAEMHQRYTTMYARRCQEKGELPGKVKEVMMYWQTVTEAFSDKHAQVKRAFEEQMGEVQHGKRLAELTPVSVSPPPLPRMPEGMAMPPMNGQPPSLTNGSHGTQPEQAQFMPSSALPGNIPEPGMEALPSNGQARDGAPQPPRPLVPPHPLTPLRPIITPSVNPSNAQHVGSVLQPANNGHSNSGNGNVPGGRTGTPTLGSVPPRPVFESTPAPRSSFDKLVATLQKSFPSCSRDDFSRLIQELRRAHGGSLSGMSLEFIVTRITQMLIARGIRPSGSAQITSSTNSNNSNSGSTSGRRGLPPPPGLNPSWSVEGLEPMGSAHEFGGVDRFEEEDPCAICHDELSSAPVTTLDCTHRFHDQCIRTWFKQQSTCPNCRIYAPLHDEFPTLK
ncbi:hypothetical protein BaRGS_00035882 [Batillaria attramentaria]|uniref:RING-type E3 ubiquitin transferase n=1 Tax=Batillaria attramentaria TaxID=370345 RepID=A0ABD0JDH5_9CAEN